MKNIKLILLFFVLFNQIGFGQFISKQETITDFEFLNEALIAHGVNYNPLNKIDILKTIAKIKKIKRDSISVMTYRYFLGLSFSEIGCIHTTVLGFPLNKKMNKKRYFPIPIWLVNQQLVLGNQDKKGLKLHEGSIVKSINGYPASFFIKRLLNYLAGDGSEKEYAAEIGSLYAPFLISFYLNYPQKYKVETTTGTITLKQAKTFKNTYRTDYAIKKETKILKIPKVYYVERNDIPVLRIEKFTKESVKFWPFVFEKLVKKKAPNFVIDIRGNGGGNREAGSELMKYLSTTEFGYEILQPNKKNKTYFNAQGKRYYRFSKMKYNVGQFHRKNKTNLGKSFDYKFIPHKQTYKGQIIVLTDGFTASTATLLTTWLKKHTNAVFIGRTTGGGYNGNNGGVFPRITLPNSKTILRFPSYRVISDSLSQNNAGLKPDVYVKYSIDDWLSKKDKDWEAVLNWIAKKKL